MKSHKVLNRINRSKVHTLKIEYICGQLNCTAFYSTPINRDEKKQIMNAIEKEKS